VGRLAGRVKKKVGAIRSERDEVVYSHLERGKKRIKTEEKKAIQRPEGPQKKKNVHASIGGNSSTRKKGVYEGKKCKRGGKKRSTRRYKGVAILCRGAAKLYF